MTRAYIGLGANLGDREATMREALSLLASEDVRITRRSSIYETDPVGFTDQPRFLNAVAEIETELDPVTLMDRMSGIEAKLGKATPFANGPRTIDLDLLLFGDRVSSEPTLVLPHPRMHERRFVLEPLAELAPDLLLPTMGVAVSAQLASLLPGHADHIRIFRASNDR